ncbi:MAG TPA: helix-turn-helix transcriptional regulator [Solirubrobacterales bacterium]|nr:helix-turn-helix transcriptional regulator [Solirubrobacterales bacterium]
MDNGIGPTLREARNRRKVELSEVEAAIKIRVRYLQAIENEEWDALPGGAYTRGFIRTYASYLGLDGDRLAEDYRRATRPSGGERAPKRVEPVPTGARRPRSRLSGRLVVVAVFALLVAVLIGIGLAGGDGGEEGSTGEPPAGRSGGGEAGTQTPAKSSPARSTKVALELTATAEVWVCLLDAADEPLVEGQVLAEGESAGPFRSKSYEAAFGNGSVQMLVDGEPASIEESSSPVGYAIAPDGDVTALEEGERPDCE